MGRESKRDLNPGNNKLEVDDRTLINVMIVVFKLNIGNRVEKS